VIQGGELNSECVLNQSFSISSCSVMSVTLSLDHELAAPLNLFDCRALRPAVLYDK
jgi:hypothetical protein